jgi:soluble cytochrome b562
MNNNEKLNEQIKEIAEMFKASFTKEEIEKMENDFEEFQKRILEQKDNNDDEPMFGNH